VVAEWAGEEERTLSVHPQKRASGLPFSKVAAFKEPLCCPLMTSTTRNVVIRGRIWWGEPSMKVLSQFEKVLLQLTPCEEA